MNIAVQNQPLIEEAARELASHQAHVDQILADTEYESQPIDIQWHLRRRCGIGGSDVGAILGVNPYKTPHEVWLEKTGRKLPDDLSNNDAVLAGTLLEDSVAEFYSIRSGNRVRRCNKNRVHPTMPWLSGNVDRIVEGESRILECKTAGHFAKGWGESGTDEVPESYLLQVTLYMAIWGYTSADLAVLTGGQKFQIYKLTLDNELFDAVAEQLHDFWFNHVIADIPPPPKTLMEINQFYNEDDGGVIPADEEVIDAIGRRSEFLALKKEVEASIKSEDEIIKGYMGTNAILAGPAGEKLATWKNQTANRFDSKSFKSDHPDTYREYTKASESRVLRV